MRLALFWVIEQFPLIVGLLEGLRHGSMNPVEHDYDR